jgi:hypothetical protein
MGGMKERSQNRDREITVTALQAQLKALRRWGSKEPADLSQIHQPVLVANGDSDRMFQARTRTIWRGVFRGMLPSGSSSTRRHSVSRW